MANSEKIRKTLEIQLKDMQLRADQAEANALKNSKKTVQKLEQRVNFLKYFIFA